MKNIESLLHSGDCKTAKCYVQNSLYDEVEAYVSFIEEGKTAIVEPVLVAGDFTLGDENSYLETSSYGVGQMVGFAVDLGAKKVILSLEKANTKDCGLGILAALGGCFYNEEGISFVPTGKTLSEIKEIDLSMMYPRLQGARFEIDLQEKAFIGSLLETKDCNEPENTIKSEEYRKLLEEGFKNVEKLFNKMKDSDFALVKGSGAAGGIGFSVLAGLNGDFIKE